MKTIQIDSSQDIRNFINHANTSFCSYLYKLHEKNVSLEQGIHSLQHDTGVLPH